MIAKIFWGVFLFLLAQVSWAGGIRNVYVNDSKMAPIYLELGKTTVLRFPNKPKKVVVGNQNYYSVEFINSDLAIQPLGNVETNLFAYGPHRTYGFVLKSCRSCNHDDLVYVKWKSKNQHKTRKRTVIKPRVPGFQSIGVKFSIGKKMEIEVVRSSIDAQRGLRIFDIQLKNISKSKFNLSGARLFASRSGKVLAQQGYVVAESGLKPKTISRARLFILSSETSGFTLNVVLGKEKSQKIIGRKYLR